MLPPRATEPVSIHADRPNSRFEIDWADGHHTVYDFEALRWLCPSAFCRGEAGTPGWLDSKPTLTPAQTQLVTAQLVGQYAIEPIWADGHQHGYYTFTLLREQCPCAECSAMRRRSPQDARSPHDGPHRHTKENG